MPGARLSEKVYRYRVPFTQPVRLAGAWHSHREGLLIRQEIPGIGYGWGEVAPLPGFSRASLDEVIAHLQQPPVTGPVPSSVTCGREGAQLALRINCGTDPGLRRTSFATCALLTGSPDEVLARAHEVRSAGYPAAKVKLGLRPIAEDKALVRGVREALGPAIELRLDANRAWSFEEARRIAPVIGEAEATFVEEPLSDASGLRELSRDMPVALDESLAQLPFGELRHHAYAAAVVIKPMLVGGVNAALALAAQAASLGMQAVISSSYETGIGMQTLLTWRV